MLKEKEPRPNRPTIPVVLSPHYDDAVFSCGGALHQWIQAGLPAVVVNVCAASPAPTDRLSPLAQGLHEEMGGGDVVAERRKEDRKALQILGVDPLALTFTDCIYRGEPAAERWYYQTMGAVFGTVHEAEHDLPKKIRAALEALVPLDIHHTLYAPLCIGGHVDHQVVQQAALLCQDAGIPVVFYEDYPYADPGYPHPLDAGNDATLEALMASGMQIEPRYLPLSQADVEAKVAAVMGYASQLAVMFGDVDRVPDRVRAFAREPDGNFVERFWVPA